MSVGVLQNMKIQNKVVKMKKKFLICGNWPKGVLAECGWENPVVLQKKISWKMR